MNLRHFLKFYLLRYGFLLSVIVFTLLIGLSFILPSSTIRFVIIASAVLLLAADLIMTLRSYKRDGMSRNNPALSGLSLGFVTNLDDPVVIVSEHGAVIWHNKAFESVCPVKGSAYGKKLADLYGTAFSLARIQRGSSEPVMLTMSDGRCFQTILYPLSSSGKRSCAVIFRDVTETETLRTEVESKSLMVAFVIIDNFSEVIRSVQDKQRTALALIGQTLDKWTASFGGILKEYDKDKYIVLFEQRHYDTLVENRFDILDKIRELEIDSISMPFTASIGVSKIDGTFAEKENAARYALDMALQRGGDQVVIKCESNVEYYGGRSKSVQKTTKVRSRVIAGELCTLMKQCGNVIVMGHKYADHDSIASCIAVSRIARSLGIPVNVVVNIHDFNLKKIFESLRGNYHEYDDLFIDRDMAHERIRSDTLLVVCDVNNPSFFELPELCESASSFVVIDHHRKTGEYISEPKISYIEPAASSVSELMCELLEQSIPHGTLPKAEANLLFSGILLDTKRFTKNTGVKTFGAAVYLRAEGAEPSEAMRLFDTSIDDFKRETVFENNVERYRDTLAISVCGEEATQSDKIAASKAADRLLTVEGIRASFVLCRIDGDTHISSRSDGTVNVQLILEKLGGGGHFDAAGAQLSGVSPEEAVSLLKEAIDGYFES